MEKSLTQPLLTLSLLLLTGYPQVQAQEISSDPLLSEFLIVFNQSGSKVVSLAEAVPDEYYDWRPNEGVRSVREVVLHLAASNYMIAGLFSAEMPEGMNLQNLEQSGVSKDEAVASLQKSYQHVGSAIEMLTAEQLSETVSFFGNEVTRRQAMLFLGNHTAEHLGQLVAYARTNGVTPPWNM